MQFIPLFPAGARWAIFIEVQFFFGELQTFISKYGKHRRQAVNQEKVISSLLEIRLLEQIE